MIRTQQKQLFSVLFILLLGTPLMLLGFSGADCTAYHGSSPKGTYDVKITDHAGPSAKWSWWSMDVTRNGKPVISDYFFSPFYAWTCVERGRASWCSESVLHFMNLSAQGRQVDVGFQNRTTADIGYAELWVRSVDSKGYPHSPSILLLFDIQKDKAVITRPEIFPGAEYFMVRCECQGKTATARFRVPSRRGWPHDIDLDDSRKRIRITLSDTGLEIDGGAFEEVTPEEAKSMVPGGMRLHLVEERRDHREQQNKASEATSQGSEPQR